MTAAVIQARMMSTRLPGKVLKPIMGRPMLSYQIERLRFCRSLDEIIIATTINSNDDPIIAFAEKEGLKFYRGSEEDVVDRYYQTAKKFRIDPIVRVTSDCPLIDPALCDHFIQVYINSNVDYVHTGNTFAEGLDCEIISFNALEKIWREASLKSEREHVTLYLNNHPELFKKFTLVSETDDSRYRICVDEPEDFSVVKMIFEALYRNNAQPFSFAKVKNFLDNNPSIYKLNSSVMRNEGLLKSLAKDKPVKTS